MSLRPKKNTKESFQQWVDADKAARIAKKLKQTTTIRKRTLAIIKRINKAESFAELHNLENEIDRIRLNKLEASAIKKATSAQAKKIKKKRTELKPPSFITHKKSGEEGTYMGQTRMKTFKAKGERVQRMVFRYALDKSGRTIWLTKDNLDNNWEEFRG